MACEQLMPVDQAVTLINPGDTVVITGSGGGVMDADFTYQALEARFLETGQPSDLTLVHVTGIGDGKGTGVTRLAHEGLVKRVIGGHWGWSTQMIQLALDDKIEAYNLPQGILSLLTREIAAGRAGVLTKLGMQTFIDPRLEGGKLNKKTTEDLVELVTLKGEDLLFYKSFPVDVAIIRGTTADEDGNIGVEQEPVDLDILSSAQAAYNSGGAVIAQVKRLARRQTLHPRMVKVPGFMVDAVVAHPEQWQTVEGEYNPAFSGEIRIPMEEIRPLEFDIRKIVARRAARELKPDAVVNLGFGIADGVANIAAEENLIEQIVFTIEQGIIGGIPAKGVIFGAGYNPDLIINAPSQFDFYHGGGLDLTFLGLAQADQYGNVNVSKFGNQLPGCGGFIDISQNAKEVVFCATFTAGGLDIDIRDGRLRILREGKIKKFVSEVEQITFSGEYAQARKQRALYVTERAVFRLQPEGMELIEIAPGVDLKDDVLAHMDFRPRIADPLPRMDPRIFQPEKMQLSLE
ncbi:MAG TPA: CoA-transferase [bacterium]|nr:CoA-transferase [bacterium]